MTLYDFNCGSQEEQATWTRHYGTYLTDRNHLGHKIALNSMNDFFTEAYYQVDDNEIDYVMGFKN